MRRQGRVLRGKNRKGVLGPHRSRPIRFAALRRDGLHLQNRPVENTGGLDGLLIVSEHGRLIAGLTGRLTHQTGWRNQRA